ncbi:MAG: ATP-dependent helicase [Clostridia bacterium]|nr:ATP-dependent helicase [Clostridia bacterium]
MFEEKLSDEIAKLTKDQLAAVMHGEGGALCIAGPGSGKTRVISLRAARLWSICEKDPGGCEGAVLTLSFNRPACDEMKSRGLDFIKKMGGKDTVKTASFYTVHAYCLKLLKEYFREVGVSLPKVLGPEDSSEIIEKIYAKISGGTLLPQDEMKRLKSFVLTEKGTPDFDFVGLDGETAISVLREYEKKKQELCALDFGDMLALSLKYLRKDGRLRDKARKAFRFTQVDEAQDLSEVQAEIIRLISNGNVFYVADDDQSIYGFRGATPGMVKSLGQNDPEFRTYKLEKNFRSGGNIVGVSSWFIRANSDRFSKKISAARNTSGKVLVRYFGDVDSQATFCVNLLKRRAKQGRTACVLYRNNVSAMPVLAKLYFEALKEKRTDGSADGRLLLCPQVRGDRMLFSDLEYLKKLHKKIKSCEDESCLSASFFSAAPLPYDIYRRLKREKIVDLVVGESFGGRRPFLRGAAASACETIVKKARCADDLLRLAGEIDGFCSGENGGLVSLSTVHSAKGLEFDTVVIIDCVDGEFPFGDPKKDEQLFEERRLMYVALTRAENEAVVTYPGRCGGRELTASRFIEEITGDM